MTAVAYPRSHAEIAPWDAFVDARPTGGFRAANARAAGRVWSQACADANAVELIVGRVGQILVAVTPAFKLVAVGVLDATTHCVKVITAASAARDAAHARDQQRRKRQRRKECT